MFNMVFLKIVLNFLVSFIVVVAVMPKAIRYLKKLKFGQVEREEGLQSHKAKGGTPTMGGTVFILCAIIVVYILAKVFIPQFDTAISSPLLHIEVDIGWFYPILVYFMFTAGSNAVNLTDGLDGLATGLSMIAISVFVIFAIMNKDYEIAIYAMAVVGTLLGFMCFNYHPARIFMGDTGSLALGGFLAALAVLTRQELLFILIGGVFLVETLSVIIQVVSFKTRGKRVFKMAPIHHHFEMLGWTEQQVVISFWFLGFICGIIGIVLGVM